MAVAVRETQSSDMIPQNAKVIFFTDFDGTITLQDTNDTLTDNLGIGGEERRRLNIECLHGRITFRKVFYEMMTNINKPYDFCLDYLLERIRVDPYFEAFFSWCEAHGVPIIILSSGLVPIIRAILERELGEERASKILIVANTLVLDKDEPNDGMNPAGWGIRFQDKSDYGHDKSRTIRQYARNADGSIKEPEDRPLLLYAGDGVSDLSAARETDLLFAKKGRDLITYCEKEGVPFTVFEDWTSILEDTKKLWEGKSTKMIAGQSQHEA